MATREETIQQLLDRIHVAGATATAEELAYLGKSLESIDNLGINVDKISPTNPTITDAFTTGYRWWNVSTNVIWTKIDNISSDQAWTASDGSAIGLPIGQQLFETNDTFIVPDGVTSVSAVCVGAGGSGHYSWANSSGGGGALAYATFTVTPGETLTIEVAPKTTALSTNGLGSYIKRGATTIFGAEGGKYSCTSESNAAKPVAGTITPKGGKGGCSSTTGYGGGGGAGGYGNTTDGSDARGGDGTYGSINTGYGSYGASGDAVAKLGHGASGAAAGGQGYQSSTYGFGAGGGVGLYGKGASGEARNTSAGNSFYNHNYFGGPGGSDGEDGAGNNNGSETINGRTMYHGEGGKFGGGGAGSGTSISSNSNFCQGGQGGVRIIWGPNRFYPSTNTQDM